MKAFLIFLAVGGAILYGLLAFTHNALQDGKAENSLAAQTQSSHPAAQQLSSWGTHLQDGTPSQKPETPLATSQLTAALPTQPSPGQSFEPKSVVDPQFVASEDKAPTIESDSAGLRAGKPEIFLQTPAEEPFPAFSPDGRWLAYASNESGEFEVYVRAFPDKGGKWQISNAGGMLPVWSGYGHELLFLAGDNRIMVAAHAARADSFVPDKPRVWSDRPGTTSHAAARCAMVRRLLSPAGVG